MSTREIDRIVARYLDGAMSPSEEEEFFVRMALDNELRQSYQAQRVVEGALRKQRQSAPRPALESRARLMEMIAAGAGAGKANASFSKATRRWWLQASAIATTISIVAITTASMLDDKRTSTVPGSIDSATNEAVAPTSSPARRSDSSSIAGPVVPGVPADERTPPSSYDAVRGRESSAGARAFESRAQREGVAATSTRTSTATPTRTSASAPSVTSTTSAPAAKPDATPRRTDSDSNANADRARVDTIKLDVRVKMP